MEAERDIKKHQSVLTAILPFHEAEIFEKSLTQESTLSMAKITMKSPQLVIRPMVLVNDTHSRQHGPVVEYAYLKELWNVQKETAACGGEFCGVHGQGIYEQGSSTDMGW